ncbi:hypothetical protein CPLU01_11338 [Colletotrichum plurivorum]|uniref:Uncharacterized protein n=1 Tax=Colletotrichum plurivorum TaxID=2175906 RepID=A0A8H6K308_9PEZI|nr:hypothetical protein CPLU01_11338 [Colletotrichum plurivorum]
MVLAPADNLDIRPPHFGRERMPRSADTGAATQTPNDDACSVSCWQLPSLASRQMHRHRALSSAFTVPSHTSQLFADGQRLSRWLVTTSFVFDLFPFPMFASLTKVGEHRHPSHTLRGAGSRPTEALKRRRTPPSAVSHGLKTHKHKHTHKRRLSPLQNDLLAASVSGPRLLRRRNGAADETSLETFSQVPLDWSHLPDVVVICQLEDPPTLRPHHSAGGVDFCFLLRDHSSLADLAGGPKSSNDEGTRSILQRPGPCDCDAGNDVNNRRRPKGRRRPRSGGGVRSGGVLNHEMLRETNMAGTHQYVRAFGRGVSCQVPAVWEAANVKVNQPWTGCAWLDASSLRWSDASSSLSYSIILPQSSAGGNITFRLAWWAGGLDAPRHDASCVAWPIQQPICTTQRSTHLLPPS